MDKRQHLTSAELIDFPVSRIWREYYAETMDGEDLPSIYPKETERIEEKKTSNNANQSYLIQRLNLFEERLNKYTAIRKKKNDDFSKGRYKDYT